MTAPITCNGLGAYMIQGQKERSYDSRQVIYKFKATLYKEDSALKIKAITVKTFEDYTTENGRAEAFEREKGLSRFCFLDTSGNAETKKLYVHEYCELPKGITHVCLDIVNDTYIPIQIVRLDSDHMKPYFKVLEKRIGIGGCTIL